MRVRTRAGGRGRLSRLAVGGAVLALLATGCTGAPGTEAVDRPASSADGGEASADDGGSSSDDGQSTSDDGASTGSAAPAEVPEGLEEFYEQELAWESCDGGECATLTVPINYEEPDGDTIELSLLRVPAGDSKQGSLVVNPGGPGGSGVDYATQAGLVVSDGVREHFDIVGFDPRGVARSAPIECFDDAQMDDYLGADPTPDDAAEEEASTELVKNFAAACEENGGELLGHVSTVEVARDMDVLRAALGEDQLDYLGASYGTFIGATYAELFPASVGRFVLDGAIDPTMSGKDMGLGQAAGFEQATREYVQSCVDGGDCPLGDDVDSGMEGITTFLDELDANPLPLDGDAAGELTEGWGVLGIIVAMYDEGAWPILTQALRAAQDGDPTTLMFLANIYAGRSSDGVYDGNSMQAITAVNCLDRAAEPELDRDQVLAEFEEVAPTFGRYLAGEGACAYWPVEAQTVLEDYDGEGAAPIVVIGTTRDPATPYEWAESLADTLSSGVLISYDGDGHTAYGRSNDCVDGAVDAYLTEGTVPEDGLSC
ncbi:alpha/beta hydrolase [Ornithinimicrobium faecis]|uniref:Alpha/beta hydrolase n=1 Tax=Ornithinimicrobium faecis TaxID=2934158 RepID=A0ABY4YSQ2_9MICO|nr:alpha/beta hydrolase [Ornithinimicrobium sp. HY1793]USQ79607.1 alpha/beta hydrolase [Ornithinimicrobium sp. HY1793]